MGASGIAVSLVFLAAAGSAYAARRPITGKLSKPGYTVIALAASGKARSVRARTGAFRVAPPAERVTLHLRAPNGEYAGPVVVGVMRTRAVVGVRAGARLGRVNVRRGYARVARRLSSGSVDAARLARARRGVPIGARVFGRVRSRPPRVAVAGDRDLDGIPDVLDIDDDGDLILDNLDRQTAARASVFATEFNPFSQITLNLDETVNANAASLTTGQIDAALSSFGNLFMGVLPGDSAELDCGGANQAPARQQGLVYCSAGGTGTVIVSFCCPAVSKKFPEEFDADGDGFGTLTPQGVFGGTSLRHGARTAQIRTGDVLIERVTTGGVETQFPAALQYVFATVPALVSYRDSATNPQHSATITYPVAAGPPPGPPGTRENGFPVAPGSDGNIVLTLTFWRPQRTPIPGEPGSGEAGAWTDIGRLVYTAGIADIGAFCPQSSFSSPFSSPSPDDLTLPTGPINRPGAGGFTDMAADQPASAAHTFGYTLNVTQCLAAKGLPAWNPGETRGLSLSGLSPNGADEAQQAVFFKRQ